MSIKYCQNCDNYIDLDTDVEHEELCGEMDIKNKFDQMMDIKNKFDKMRGFPLKQINELAKEDRKLDKKECDWELAREVSANTVYALLICKEHGHVKKVKVETEKK